MKLEGNVEDVGLGSFEKVPHVAGLVTGEKMSLENQARRNADQTVRPRARTLEGMRRIEQG